MKISIITVHFKDLPGLLRTADSVEKLRRQNAVQIEWIIIDGGTSFSSDEWFRERLQREADQFISEPDGGIYDAMNKGLNLASGDYSIFMNAGDVFANECDLGMFFVALKQSRPVMIWGAAYECAPGDVPKLKLPRKISSLWYGMPTHHQAMFFLTRPAKDIKYDLDFGIAADFKLVCELARLPEANIFYTNMPICIFDMSGVSTRKFWKGLGEQQIIRKNVLNVPVLKNFMIYLLKCLARVGRGSFSSVYEKMRYSARIEKGRV